MSLILHLETTTTMCSVALARQGELLAEKSINEGYSHAEKLSQFIDGLFRENDLKPSQLDAVAVSQGPGSYTGLRIGVSTAKGIAYALKIPMLAVDTLQAMAREVTSTMPSADQLYCPMIDARRMEVFTAVYDGHNKAVEPITAKIIDTSSFQNFLVEKPVVFFGNGAAKCQEMLGSSTNAIFLEDKHPSASSMIPFAAAALEAEQFVDVAYFEPFYLKDFVATTPRKLI